MQSVLLGLGSTIYLYAFIFLLLKSVTIQVVWGDGTVTIGIHVLHSADSN